MSIMVGIGGGAQMGVLIRDAEALERMEKVTTLLVDKTGTLTAGRPQGTVAEPAAGFDRAILLRFAASLEREANIRSDPRSLRPQRRTASRSTLQIEARTGKGLGGFGAPTW
jgi:Cu+-exporting ATPase